MLEYLLDENDETLDVFPTTWTATSGGDFEASFLFESTAPGDLHLDVVSLAGAVTFDSVVGRFKAPYEGIELTLQDQLPGSDWSFDVVDGSTGQELTEFAVTLRVPGGVDRTYPTHRRPWGARRIAGTVHSGATGALLFTLDTPFVPVFFWRRHPGCPRRDWGRYQRDRRDRR